jgi:hypothetical protein
MEREFLSWVNYWGIRRMGREFLSSGLRKREPKKGRRNLEVKVLSLQPLNL